MPAGGAPRRRRLQPGRQDARDDRFLGAWRCGTPLPERLAGTSEASYGASDLALSARGDLVGVRADRRFGVPRAEVVDVARRSQVVRVGGRRGGGGLSRSRSAPTGGCWRSAATRGWCGSGTSAPGSSSTSSTPAAPVRARVQPRRPDPRRRRRRLRARRRPRRRFALGRGHGHAIGPSLAAGTAVRDDLDISADGRRLLLTAANGQGADLGCRPGVLGPACLPGREPHPDPGGVGEVPSGPAVPAGLR